jgi:hypothetical protein
LLRYLVRVGFPDATRGAGHGIDQVIGLLKWSKVSQEIAKESPQEGESQEKERKKGSVLKRKPPDDGELQSKIVQPRTSIIWSKKSNDWSTHARTPHRGANQFGTS